MGEVYQARDTTLDRDVALKVLPEAFTSDSDRLARFEREAKVLASLNHPNIGTIYGREEALGVKALVLELIEGPTLADRILQGPIPLDEALPIAKQIAEALEAAHEAGVIHRDLKPANIKVREDGTVKVLDFGLAKPLDPTPTSDPSDSPTLTVAATQMGVIMGTAPYMSPEQARGKSVDKRSDIWAFGCVLYEMLTGRRPFEGRDVSEVLGAVLRLEPDWDGLPDDTPPRVSTLLRRCVEKEPKQRVHDVADVRLAMAGAFETTDSATSESIPAPMLRIWQRPMGFAVAVLVALVVGGVAVWTLTRPAPSPPGLLTRFPIPLGANQGFSSTALPIVAISPDGSQVVYAADNNLWLRPVDQLQAVRLAGGGGGGPFFSADGQSIGFWAAGQLKKVPVSGGPPVTIADVPTLPRGANWGANDMILYGGPDGIMQVPGVSGTPVLLIPGEDGERLHGPQMLPDGEWVLFTVLAADRASWDDGQIVAQSITTGERMLLIEGGRDGRYVPTGHVVYVLNNVLLAVPFDVDSFEVAGGQVPLVEGVRVASEGQPSAHFGVSTIGSLVYVPGSTDGGDTFLTWVGRDGDEETVPAAPPRAYGRPRVSPDGTRVAVDITDGDSRDIWIWDLVRETLTQLTFDEADDNYPLWTPDGARVLFTSSREGGGLFWKAADGTGQVERLKEGLARPYTWAADGRLLFEEALTIGVLTMDGERTVEMLIDDAGFDVGEPALSPDGRWLAYYRTHEGGDPTIDVVPFPNIYDGHWSVSQQGGGAVVQPVWSPNERELFYRSDTGLMVAQVETAPAFSNRTPELLFTRSRFQMRGGPEEARQWDLAPGGDRFLVRTAATQATDDGPFSVVIFVENWFEELKRVPVN